MADEPIFHLALAADWQRAQEVGEYAESTIGRSLEEEGFIHCSFAHQVQGVADMFYRGRDDLILLCIDPDRLDSEVKVEGEPQKFPHVYGPIPIQAVVAADQVPANSATIGAAASMAASPWMTK